MKFGSENAGLWGGILLKPMPMVGEYQPAKKIEGAFKSKTIVFFTFHVLEGTVSLMMVNILPSVGFWW